VEHVASILKVVVEGNPEISVKACGKQNLAYSSTLKMEATCSSETPPDLQRTTRLFTPEDRTLHDHCSENLISNIKQFYSLYNGRTYPGGNRIVSGRFGDSSKTSYFFRNDTYLGVCLGKWQATVIIWKEQEPIDVRKSTCCPSVLGLSAHPKCVTAVKPSSSCANSTQSNVCKSRFFFSPV
jgi:hypothetical protein